MAEFGELLHTFRERAQLSQRALAKEIGVDPSYVNRLERSERNPPDRDLTLKMAAALKLTPAETDAFIFAAGGLPLALERLSWPDPTIVSLADVLADPTIPMHERKELRQIITLLLHRWRPNTTEPQHNQ